MTATGPAHTRLAPRGWTIRSDTPGRLRAAHPDIGAFLSTSRKVQARLLQTKGVKAFSVSLVTSNILVRYDPDVLSRAALLSTLAETVAEARRAPNQTEVGVSSLPSVRAMRRVTLSTANLALVGAGMVFAPLYALGVATTAVAAAHIVFAAVESIFVERRLKVDVLDATVIGLLFAYDRIGSAALMTWLVDSANALLESTSEYSAGVLADVFGQRSQTAVVLVDGEEVERDVAQLEAGDIVVVSAGQQIPADGVVVAGEAMIDQHALTGESYAVEREIGDRVFHMTTVLAGTIHARVEQAGEQTNAARIVSILNASITYRTRLQTSGERFAEAMVLPTFGAGALGYGLRGPEAGIAILNADYGTGIRVAAPLAMVASIARAARNGVVVKNGAALETLKDVDAFVFDKTGTLTHDTPEIGRVETLDAALDASAILAMTAAAERRFSHPVARAVVNKARDLDLDLPPVDATSYRIGFGVEVRFDGKTLRIGSRRYLAREGVETPASVEPLIADIFATGRSALFVALENRLVGVIEIAAGERPEAARVIDDLRNRRHVAEIHLLSGDNEEPTRALASKLGIEQYRSSVLPHEKAAFVSDLQRRGLKVAMVGDGVNDSVALAQADCSISLHGASDIATDVADVVFMDGDLAKFWLLFDLADRLSANVRRSLLLTVIPNTLLLAGALGGYFGIGTSLLLNNGLNLVAVGNGLLPFYESSRHEEAHAIDVLPPT